MQSNSRSQSWYKRLNANLVTVTFFNFLRVRLITIYRVYEDTDRKLASQSTSVQALRSGSLFTSDTGCSVTSSYVTVSTRKPVPYHFVE
jgi:hypothetical protein